MPISCKGGKLVGVSEEDLADIDERDRAQAMRDWHAGGRGEGGDLAAMQGSLPPQGTLRKAKHKPPRRRYGARGW